MNTIKFKHITAIAIEIEQPKKLIHRFRNTRLYKYTLDQKNAVSKNMKFDPHRYLKTSS